MNKKRSVRLTRRSYRRKLVMFGVSIFMSLALVSTGFAAWVLSKDAKLGTSGEVEIGAVSEANVEIKDLIFTEKDTYGQEIKNFVFEPLEIDTTGRVRYDGESKPEDLDIKISWTVVNYQNVDDLFVEFKLSEDVKTVIDSGYITLPQGFELQEGTEPIEDNKVEKTYYVARYNIGNAIVEDGETKDKLLSYKVTKEGDAVTVVFNMTLKFAWGATFDGKNPGIYYDTTYEDDVNKGMGVPYDTVKQTLNRFKATLHGIPYNAAFEEKTEDEKAALYDQNPVDKYYVVVNATVA